MDIRVATLKTRNLARHVDLASHPLQLVCSFLHQSSYLVPHQIIRSKSRHAQHLWSLATMTEAYSDICISTSICDLIVVVFTVDVYMNYLFISIMTIICAFIGFEIKIDYVITLT